MDITLFNHITTEDALRQLELNGEKYTDLYVDMNEKEQRKYVKDSASMINDMLKKLDRARIDKSKNYKAKVEAEAKHIRERLQAANEPFTALIDAHNMERKRILEAEKAKQAAIDLAKQIELDHEIGLLLNDKFDSEKEQREADRIAVQKVHDEQVAADAIAREQARIEAEELRLARDKKLREADIEHKRQVNRNAVNALIANNCRINEEQAKAVVKAIASGSIPYVSINY